MNINLISFSSIVALTGIVCSCSPVVGVYTLKGKVSDSARKLVITEYKDGTVTGKMSATGSSRSYVYSTGSIGGKIEGSHIRFIITPLGESYLSGKIASANSGDGNAPYYSGKINRSRSSLYGNWKAIVNGRTKRGSFNFERKINTNSGGDTKPGEITRTGGLEPV